MASQRSPVAEAAETPQPAVESSNGHHPEFIFTPKDGEPITVPAVATAIPDGKQRWFFWKLRKLQGLDQPIFWLEQAGVADDLQERIMLLGDEEWQRFFSEWMAASTGATPGE